MNNREKEPLKKMFYFLRPLAGDKNKWNGFRNYLLSPLHANSARKANILDCIWKTRKLSGKQAENQLALLLFPQKDPLDEKTKTLLRKTLTLVLEEYYGYISFLRYKQDFAVQRRYLLQEANDNRWDDYFPWIYNKRAIKSLESYPKTETYFAHKMELANQLDEFLSRGERDSVNIKGRYWDELRANSNQFAIIQLKLACNLQNQNQLSGQEKWAHVPYLKAILSEIEKNWESQPSLLQAYYLIYKGITDPDKVEYYHSLRKLLFEKGKGFGRKEARKLFQHANNYCTRKYNFYHRTGDTAKSQQFQQELVALYDFQLREKIIFQTSNGVDYIHHRDFKNIVVFFSKMGRLTWVEGFIQSYGHRILKSLRTAGKHFGLAILFFYQKDFRAAHHHLTIVQQELKDSNDRNYALSVKGYFLRVLFELGKYEQCEREAKNAAKSLIRGKHLTPPSQQRAYNFCTYLKAICENLDQPRLEKRQSLEELKLKISHGPPCNSKDWLIEKIGKEMP